MVQIKKLFQIILLLIPAVFIILSYALKSPLWHIGTALSLFLPVSFLDVCKRRENLWIFLFVAVYSLPFNIWVFKIVASFFSYSYSKFGTYVYALLVFFVAFSVEELAFATITRIIWKRQYKLFSQEFLDL